MTADPRLAKVRQTKQRLDAAERDTRTAREAFRQAIADAQNAGVSLTAIGKELGVSRQRVYRIMRGE